MAVFPSKEWVALAVEAVNLQADLPKALAGLPADLAAVVEASPPHLPRALAVYGRQKAGRIESWKVLGDEDEILELEPAYVLSAPYAIWKDLMKGGDPVKAAMSGKVKVQGDLQALIRRAQFRYIVDAALQAVPTTFVDER